MLLAELEFYHSRKIAPTRRLALGKAYLPLQTPPGNGPLLLAGIVGEYLPKIDQDLHEEFLAILFKVQRGESVTQPRLRHRLQQDKVGLSQIRHRLSSTNGKAKYSFGEGDVAPEQNVLAAAYAAGEFPYSARSAIMNLLRKSMKWSGEIGEDFISFLLGHHKEYIVDIGHKDSKSWALHVLGITNPSPTRSEIKQCFRELLRTAHPDTGNLNEDYDAAQRISDLTEARRILLR